MEQTNTCRVRSERPARLSVAPLAPALLAWARHSLDRKDLPWRRDDRSVYEVWLSEVMLQQTQVATVIPYFERFTSIFPNLKTLANAKQDDVLELWSGLGYYARARNLHRSAQIILKKHNGVFPRVFSEVLALPGVGRSTAGAVLSLAFGLRHAILDANAKRVLARYHAKDINSSENEHAYQKTLWALADAETPTKDVITYTQAIMDLGALVCRPKSPRCEVCPLSHNCLAHQRGDEERYPTPKQKASKPIRIKALIIFQNFSGEVYLEKRPEKGIWGGLYSFPECVNEPDAILRSLKSFDPDAKNPLPLPSFHHAFSHYYLEAHPYRVRTRLSGTGFYDLARPHQALPTPIRRLLKKLCLNKKEQ